MKPVIQEASKFEIELSTSEILARLHKGLTFRGWYRLLDHGSELSLKYKVKSSIASCSDTILIHISEINENKSLIEVQSKPHLLTSIFNRSNGIRNINKVKEVFNIII